MEKDCVTCKHGSNCQYVCNDWSDWTPKDPPSPDRITAHAEWYREVVKRLVTIGGMIVLSYEPETRGQAVQEIIEREVAWYISVARHFDGHAREDMGK